MDDIFRHLSRLNLIYQMPIAEEKLSLNTHVKDFVYYYFSRFITNITHMFADFTTSEIADFDSRYKSKLDLLVKYPNLNLNGIIVPIPKGMVKSYKQTMTALFQILDTASPQTIKTDLEMLHSAMGTGKIKTLSVSPFSKLQFDTARGAIGKLFGKVGLTHATALHALVSKTEIKQVHDGLVKTTDLYYREVLSLNPLITKIEQRHAEIDWVEQDRTILANHLMTMAYRLSVLAIVMNHVQETEHAFVKDLNILLAKIN